MDYITRKGVKLASYEAVARKAKETSDCRICWHAFAAGVSGCHGKECGNKQFSVIRSDYYECLIEDGIERNVAWKANALKEIYKLCCAESED